jgi:Ca-activated chloride channel family protein
MKRWSIYSQGKLLGPYTLAQLQQMTRAGTLAPGDLVSPENGGAPSRAKDIAGLFHGAPVQPVPLAPFPKATPPPIAAPPISVVLVPTLPPQPSPVPRATATAPARNRFSLPKPLLFAICGTIGGLAAAVFLGLIASCVLYPAPQRAQAKIRIAQPDAMGVYLGDKNRFKVKVARDHWRGALELRVDGVPAGVTAQPVTIAAEAAEAEVEVLVDAGVPIGTHRMRVVAVAAHAQSVEPADGFLQLKVIQPPVKLAIAVSDPVRMHQGGKNRFVVKAVRRYYEGDVQIRFRNPPDGVSLPPIVILAGSSEMEVEASAADDAVVGIQKVLVEAESAERGKVIAAQTAFTAEILVRPLPKVDIIFVLDTTGSMSNAIFGIRNGITGFAKKLESQRIDARIGLVDFRDVAEPDNGTRPTALVFGGETLTRDYEAFSQRVGALRAGGGGNTIDESCLQGLVEASTQPFRRDAAKVLILITDAGARIHRAGDKFYNLSARQVDSPPYSVDETAEILTKAGITQLHIVATRRDYDGSFPFYQGSPQNAYKHFHGQDKPNRLQGEFFDIAQVIRDANQFAKMLPTVGQAISSLTKATPPAPLPNQRPAPPPVDSGSALPPPEEVAGLKAVQSTQTYAETDKYRLIFAAAVWTAIIAGGISLLILFGQQFYLRRSLPPLADSTKVLAGGLLAGLVGGAIGQAFVQITSGGVVLDAMSKVIGWGLLGSLIGGGMSFFVPNLRWNRGLGGGLIGGIIGALVFLVIAVILRLTIGLILGETLGRYVGDAIGQLAGAAVLGFCIGLMVALAELAFRSRWLEITFGAREVRTVTLGTAAVTLGSDEKRVSVVVEGAPALALRYRVDRDHVLCENLVTGATAEVQPGDLRTLASVSIAVCSSGSARASGFALQLDNGTLIPLGVGMPLTADDLPGLEPQGTDRTVALVSSRPNDPKTLLLRNRSRQTWKTQDRVGQGGIIEPGRSIELAAGLQIAFGPVRGTLLENA